MNGYVFDQFRIGYAFDQFHHDHFTNFISITIHDGLLVFGGVDNGVLKL